MSGSCITTGTTSDLPFLVMFGITVFAATACGAYIALTVTGRPTKTSRRRHRAPRADRPTRHVTIPSARPTTDDAADGYIPALRPAPLDADDTHVSLVPRYVDEAPVQVRNPATT